MPSANYDYCYCTSCADTPDGCTLQQSRTRYNHEKADRRKAEKEEREQAQMQEDGEAGYVVEDEQPIMEHEEVHRDVEAEGFWEPDLDDEDDEDGEDVDGDDDIVDHPSDYSMPQSDEDERPDNFQETPLSDSDDDIPLEPRVDEEDLLEDPLFLRLDSLPYDDGGDDDDNDEYGDPGELADLPPAFDEHPAIRNAYIRAFLMGSLKGCTHAAIQMHLEGVSVALRSAIYQSDDVQYPGLENMARTLSTAEKRLGISTEHFITYYFLCDNCWTPYHPSRLTKLATATCEKVGCSGTLFTIKQLSKGVQKRTPIKILPYVSLHKAVQHILLRPGKFDQLQRWRGPDDEPKREPPLQSRGMEAFADPDRPMTDIYDGWGWRAIQMGLERRRGGAWTVKDVDVQELHQRLVSCPLGLVWQMNIDWQVASYCS